jgi:hypothetical protein
MIGYQFSFYFRLSWPIALVIKTKTENRKGNSLKTKIEIALSILRQQVKCENARQWPTTRQELTKFASLSFYSTALIIISTVV